MQLRTYQHDAIEALFHWWAAGRVGPGEDPLVCLPTAAGKTVIFSALIQRLMHEYPGVSVLILAHRKELISQAEAKLLSVWPEAPVGVYAASLGRREIRPITIASRDTIARVIEDVGQFTFVIIDEAHRLSVKEEGQYRTLIAKLRAQYEHLVVIGFTATPFRLGQGRIYGPGKPFADLAYHIGMSDLIQQGYLAPLTSSAPAHGAIDTTGIKITAGDFNEHQLEERATAEGVIEAALDEWFETAYAQGRKASVFFCVSIKHATMTRDALRARGIHAEAISGKTPNSERDALLSAFDRGEYPALCNVGVLTEGWDCPRCDCVVLMRPTHSASLYCLDHETEILTSHGWAGIGKIAVGDCALAMNEKTGSGAWSRVTGTVVRQMESQEKWVEYDAPRANFRVTDQHRMLFATNADKEGDRFAWRLDTAYEMAKLQNGVYMPTSVEIDQPGIPLTDAEIYLICIIMTDGTISSHQVTIYQSERYPEVMKRIEESLDACGILYKKTKVKAATQYKENYQRWRYSISAGEPKTEKTKKGIRYLYPWLNKDVSPALMSLSKVQFDKLLDAIWDGDGFKKSTVDYTPRSKTISTARSVAADRLQALGAMHGYTVHLRYEHKNRKNPIAIMTFTNRSWRSVGGAGDRPQISVSPSTEELVWCIETEHGTIVTRRKGKVTVMGNCQMVGRGLRLSPETGKRDCLILDFGGNIERLGPVDQADEREPKARKAKKCPACGHSNAPDASACEQCGTLLNQEAPYRRCGEWEPDEGEFINGCGHKNLTAAVKCEACGRMFVRHEAQAKRGGIISTERAYEDFPVERMSWRVAVSQQTGNAYLRIGYHAGLFEVFYKNLMLGYDGFAGQKAIKEWAMLTTNGTTPQDANHAADMLDFGEEQLKTPTTITVDVASRWKEIVRFDFSPSGSGLEEMAQIRLSDAESYRKQREWFGAQKP